MENKQKELLKRLLEFELCIEQRCTKEEKDNFSKLKEDELPIDVFKLEKVSGVIYYRIIPSNLDEGQLKNFIGLKQIEEQRLQTNELKKHIEELKKQIKEQRIELEMQTGYQRRQTDEIKLQSYYQKTIKNCLIFFVVLAIIGLICGIAFSIQFKNAVDGIFTVSSSVKY